MKKSTKRTTIGIIAVLIFFAAIGFTCFTIQETLAGLSDSTIAYVEAYPESNPKTVDNAGVVAIADPSETDSELTYTAPLGETLTTGPNYTSTYLVITTIEFTILSILLILTPIFVRVLISKKTV